MNHEIYRIAHLISEDPDLILEEDQELVVRYTNIYGETHNLSILKAYAITDYGTNQTIRYQVVWPDGSIGTLTYSGLSPESREKLTAVALPMQEYNRLRYQKIRAKKQVSKHKRSRDKWDYMYAMYGRCCPDWYMEDHMTGTGACYQNPGADEFVRNLRGRYRNSPEVRAEMNIAKPVDVGVPRPQQKPRVIGAHHTDYGMVQVGAIKSPDGGRPQFKVAMAGEEPRVFATEEETVQYLRDELDLNI